MNKRKLGVAVSAMILAVHLGSPVAAEPSLEQLNDIATILADNDVAALCDYLDQYPELLEGDTQLSLLLRQFRRESEDLTSCLGIEPNLRDALVRNPALLGRQEEGSDSGEDEEPEPGPDPVDEPDPDPAPDPEPNPDPVDEPDPGPDPGDGGIY